MRTTRPPDENTLVTDEHRPVDPTPAEWDEDRTAEELKITKATLRNWRTRGEGPVYMKIGKRVQYAPEDVKAWIREQRRAPGRAAS